MREEIKPEVQAFVKAHGRPPGLGIVLVGEDPASHVYVRNKLKAAEDVGFYADCTRMAPTPRSTTCCARSIG
jgi:methylenetetrahydrofolate dehydrogenase (NADP+)/methenyltetrahydrofolate cyclohydrolase